MKRKIVLLLCIFACLFFGREGFFQTCEASPESQPPILVTPLLDSVTMDNGAGHIPFKAENTSSTTMSVIGENGTGTADLVTSAISGERIPIEEFRTGFSVGGGPYFPIVLKPGQSCRFSSKYAIDTLTFLKNKNKELYGEVLAWPAGTKVKPKEYYSNPIPISPKLTTLPWIDLGEKNYFMVIADIKDAAVNPHKLSGKIWMRGAVQIPVSIKNTSNQFYIVGTHSISFYIAGRSAGRISASPWEAVRAMTPILKPGESVATEGDVDLDWLQSQNYKPGEKLVAAVGGRIPNTNQIFESYSAPFEIPPLPRDKRPKGVVEIPGI